MKQSTYNIALAGIFSALQIVLVYLSFVIEPVTISLQVLASVCLMIPIAKGARRESILSYFVVSVVSFLLTGIPFCLTYVLFSGLYTLISILLVNAKISRWILLIPKVIYVNVLFYLFYEVFKGMIVIDFSMIGFEIGYPILACIVAVLTIAFDMLLLRMYALIEAKLHKPTSDSSSGGSSGSSDI